MRCSRLKLDSSNLLLLNETCLEDIEESITDENLLSSIPFRRYIRAKCPPPQVRSDRCANVQANCNGSQRAATLLFIVGHVTKEGALAGPKVLEHIMDTVLYFEGEREENFKILRAYKTASVPYRKWAYSK